MSSVGILTLGCKVNQYESEAIAERCKKLGYTVLSPEDVCDNYIINTCTVTAEADRKSCQMVRRLHQRNPAARIIVTGCTAQRSPSRIAAIEGVYAVIGNACKLRTAELLSDSGINLPAPVTEIPPLEGTCFERMSLEGFPRTRAYIKIEDGCENRCAYCAIPDARGPVRSRPPEDIEAEVLGFVRSGTREIVLTGIETASYGRDGGGTDLSGLLKRIDRICGGCRIRLGSVDPTLFRQEFVDTVASLGSCAHHFHISMQSGSSHVLALMRRRYNALQASGALARIRTAMPDVMFTTDIIVGFPGETPEDFEQTRSFIRNEGFLMTHIFPYSQRKGTVACTLPGQIPQEEKHRRAAILAEDAAQTRKQILEKFVKDGSPVSVLFETFENGICTGHSGNFIEISAPSQENLHGRLTEVIPLSTDGEAVTGILKKD